MTRYKDNNYLWNYKCLLDADLLIVLPDKLHRFKMADKVLLPLIFDKIIMCFREITDR